MPVCQGDRGFSFTPLSLSHTHTHTLALSFRHKTHPTPTCKEVQQIGPHNKTAYSQRCPQLCFQIKYTVITRAHDAPKKKKGAKKHTRWSDSGTQHKPLWQNKCAPTTLFPLLTITSAPVASFSSTPHTWSSWQMSNRRLQLLSSATRWHSSPTASPLVYISGYMILSICLPVGIQRRPWHTLAARNLWCPSAKWLWLDVKGGSQLPSDG